jgi:hypothetical protein
MELAPFRQVPAAMTAKEQRSKAGSWKRTDDHPPVGSPIEPAHYVKEMARPQPHPLATLATELQELPVTRLRAMAGIRSKSIRKAQLVAMVAACSC